MTSINDIRIVGKLVKAPEFLETTTKKRFAKILIETWKYVRINGESRRVSHTHTVLCFNQFSLKFLETQAKVGCRIKVLGELTYDRNDKAEIIVLQYSGELGPMDDEEHALHDSEANKQSEVQSTPGVSKQGGGLGRLGIRQPHNNSDRDDNYIRQEKNSYESSLSEDDEIPF